MAGTFRRSVNVVVAVVALAWALEARADDDAAWRKYEGYWSFTTTIPDQPVDRGYLLILRDRGLYVGVWGPDGKTKWNHVRSVKATPSQVQVSLQWFWTRDEIVLQPDGADGLRGTWKSSFKGEDFMTKLERVKPSLQSVGVQRLRPEEVVLDVSGSNLPPAASVDTIRGAIDLGDPGFIVKSATYPQGQSMLRVRLEVTPEARPGPQTLFVNGSAIGWTLPDIRPALSFVKKKGSGLIPAEALVFGNEFFVEARYPTPAPQAETKVTLSWDGGRREVVLKKTSDPKVLRSDAIKAKKPRREVQP